jgi:small subunit ribosomal protein S12
MATFRQTGLKKTKGLKKQHTNNLVLLNNGPQKRGIVTKLRIMSPKKPNSAKRRVVKLRVPSMRRNLVAKLKGQGSNLQSYSKVLVCGGRANDLPGVRYNMVKGAYDSGWQENIIRKKGRSKYGMRLEDLNYAIERKLEEDSKKKKK